MFFLMVNINNLVLYLVFIVFATRAINEEEEEVFFWY